MPSDYAWHVIWAEHLLQLVVNDGYDNFWSSDEVVFHVSDKVRRDGRSSYCVYRGYGEWHDLPQGHSKSLSQVILSYWWLLGVAATLMRTQNLLLSAQFPCKNNRNIKNVSSIVIIADPFFLKMLGRKHLTLQLLTSYNSIRSLYRINVYRSWKNHSLLFTLFNRIGTCVHWSPYVNVP